MGIGSSPRLVGRQTSLALSLVGRGLRVVSGWVRVFFALWECEAPVCRGRAVLPTYTSSWYTISAVVSPLSCSSNPWSQGGQRLSLQEGWPS